MKDGDLVYVSADEVHVGKRFRTNCRILPAMVESIGKVGILTPILIDKNKHLICGYGRLTACGKAGVTKIPALVRDLDDVGRLIAERDENNVSDPFTIEEKVEIGQAVEAAEKAKAKERQAATQAKPGIKIGAQGAEKFSAPTGNGRAADKAAEAVGMSRPTYEKAKAVVEAAKADPVNADLVEEMNTTGKVSGAHKKLEERNGKPCTVNGVSPGPQPKPPKVGQPYFDDRLIEEYLGKLIRAFDTRAGVYGKSREHKDCMDTMEPVVAAWRRWQRVTTSFTPKKG